jgi:predicted DNA-binding antitoxin AbrB/MazE fold protein
MREVIGFIKNKKVDLPNGESIRFTLSIEQLIEEGRKLYLDAFKKNVAGAEEEYYAYSTAQFLVYGRQRLNAAIQLVKQQFESLFTTYYIEKGRNYIAPYIEALPAENQLNR